MGLFTATVCDDGPFPWAPETPLGQRPGLLATARSALPRGSTGPFGIWATDLGPAPFCLLWPTQARRPGIGSGPLPNVPVLVFAGSATSGHPPRMRPRLPRASRRDGS